MNYEAPHYTTISILLQLPPSCVQILVSTTSNVGRHEKWYQSNLWQSESQYDTAETTKEIPPFYNDFFHNLSSRCNTFLWLLFPTSLFYQLQQGSKTRNNCINCLENIILITSCSYGQSIETVPNQWLACHTADNSVASAAAQWLMMPPIQQCCQWQKASPYHIKCQRINIYM